jgi:hypothetical protein
MCWTPEQYLQGNENKQAANQPVLGGEEFSGILVGVIDTSINL